MRLLVVTAARCQSAWRLYLVLWIS